MNKAMLGLALAATVLAVIFAPEEEADLVVTSNRPTPATPSSAKALASNKPQATSGDYKLQIKPRQWEQKADGDQAADAKPALAWGSGLFAATNWAPPPPPPAPAPPIKVKAEKPPPPSAPPLPFRYLGRWEDAGEVSYFLQQNEGNLVVKVGQKIGLSYKLESVQAGQLQFIYLPLQQTQTLAVGEVN